MGFWNTDRLRTPDMPHVKAQKMMNETRKKYRKEIEDTAHKIHPTYGKVVRSMNNVDDTLENVKDTFENGILRSLFSSEVKSLNLADHLFVQRFGYTHHGIYIGDGRVIHYLSERVKEDTLETFADGAKIHKKSNEESPIRYTRQQAVNRAYRRYSESQYNVVINNCDSFVRWCRAGGEEY